MASLPRCSRMLRRSSRWMPVLAILLMLAVVLSVLLSFGIFFIPIDVDNTKAHSRSAMTFDGIGKRGEQWTETLSWEPRVFIHHNFLSKEECEHLIALAKPHLKTTLVIDPKTGRGKESRVRTSTGMFLPRGHDLIVQAIERRISDFIFIPVEHGEGLQILHYEVGQKYEPHADYFVDHINTKIGGQRIATVLMYLSDVEEGGETVFPYAKTNVTSLPWYNQLSECGKKGLSVKPKMGDAILFWSLKPDATLDPSSIHGGCPVIKGNKWLSTKWMHIEELKIPFPPSKVHLRKERIIT